MKKISMTIAAVLAMYTMYGQASGNVLSYSNSTHNLNYYNKSLDDYVASAAQPVRNSFYLEVNAMENVKADSYLAIFNISQIGATAQITDSLVNHRIAKFKKQLDKNQVETIEVVTDMLTFLPAYEVEVEKKLFSKSYNEVPIGFELQKNIHIHFKDINQLDKIITSAAMSEVYDLVKVDYFVENTEEIYNRLRERAIKQINAKAEDFKKLGISLDSLKIAFSEDKNVAFPLDRYKTYNMQGSVTMEALKRKKGVTKAQKKSSKYYSKIPHHKYDIIINPAMAEPGVQYTYNFKILFTMKQKVSKVIKKKEYYILSNDGQLQQLKINP